MTVPNVHSHLEKAPVIPSQNPDKEGASDVFAHRSAPASQATREGQVLIGEGVQIKGEIRECREIEIHGTMEGDLKADVVIVHETGLVKGNINTDRAEVHGSIDGEINVKFQLDVKATGSVAGKTKYGQLSVEAGGRVTGTLDGQADNKDRLLGTAAQKPNTDATPTESTTAPTNSTGSEPALT